MLAGPISIMSLISTITSIKNQEKQISQIDTIIGKAEDIFNKYNTLKKSLKTLISSHNTHAKSLTEVVHTSYGSSQGLESKIIKLKDDHGLDVNQLVKTDDKDKMVNFVEDPEDINKPN
jgi:DNA anti-recombination protein RmuC